MPDRLRNTLLFLYFSYNCPIISDTAARARSIALFDLATDFCNSLQLGCESHGSDNAYFKWGDPFVVKIRLWRMRSVPFCIVAKHLSLRWQQEANQRTKRWSKFTPNNNKEHPVHVPWGNWEYMEMLELSGQTFATICAGYHNMAEAVPPTPTNS